MATRQELVKQIKAEGALNVAGNFVSAKLSSKNKDIFGYAEQIKDYGQQKFQSDINADVNQRLQALEEKKPSTDISDDLKATLEELLKDKISYPAPKIKVTSALKAGTQEYIDKKVYSYQVEVSPVQITEVIDGALKNKVISASDITINVSGDVLDVVTGVPQDRDYKQSTFTLNNSKVSNTATVTAFYTKSNGDTVSDNDNIKMSLDIKAYFGYYNENVTSANFSSFIKSDSTAKIFKKSLPTPGITVNSSSVYANILHFNTSSNTYPIYVALPKDWVDKLATDLSGVVVESVAGNSEYKFATNTEGGLASNTASITINNTAFPYYIYKTVAEKANNSDLKIGLIRK